jgi:hypothetical protein
MCKDGGIDRDDVYSILAMQQSQRELMASIMSLVDACSLGMDDEARQELTDLVGALGEVVGEFVGQVKLVVDRSVTRVRDEERRQIAESVGDA